MAEYTEIIKIKFEYGDAIQKTAELTQQQADLKKEVKSLREAQTPDLQLLAEKESALRIVTTALRDQRKVVDNITLAQSQATGSNKQYSAELSNLTIRLNQMSEAERFGTEEGRKLNDQAAELSAKLSASEQSVGKFGRAVGDYGGQFANTISGMKQRLAELQQVVQTTDVGSQQFKDAQDEAGNLTLKIGQLEGRLDSFGNREPKNPAKDAFEDGIATAGAFASAINLVNMAVDEGSTASEVLAKSTKALAVSQSIANIVSQKDAVLQTIRLGLSKGYALAQGAVGVVTGIVTGLTATFGVTATAAWAAATLGVSALIAGIVLLIANFESVINTVGSFLGLIDEENNLTGEQIDQKRAYIATLDEQIDKEQRLASNKIKAIDREITLAESLGQSTVELEKKKQRAIIETLNTQAKLIQAQIDSIILLEKAGAATEDEISKRKDLQKQLDDTQNAIKDANTEIQAIDNKEKKRQDDEAKKKADEAKKKRDEARQKRKDAQKQAADDEKKYQQDLLKLEDEYYKSSREKLIQSFTDKLKDIREKGNKEIALRAEIARQQAEAVAEFDRQNAIKEIENSKKTEEQKTIAILAINKKFYEDQIKLAQENAALDGKISDLEAERIKKYQTELDKVNKQAIDRADQEKIDSFNKQAALNDLLLKNELDRVDIEVSSEREKTRRKLQINLDYLNKQIEIAKQLADSDKIRTEEEIANIQAIQNQIEKTSIELKKSQEENTPKTIGEIYFGDTEEAAKFQEKFDFAVESFNQIIGLVNQGYADQIEQIKEKNNTEIDGIEKSKMSEEEKKIAIDNIKKKTAQETYQLQLKQFNADKALAVVNAIIKGAEAVLGALARTGGNPIAGAIAGALSAFQITKILSQAPPPPPKFAKGVIGLSGSGNSTSDSIPAMLSNGESVITASGTRYAETNFPGLLNFLNQKNKFADGIVSLNQSPIISAQANLSQQIREAIQDLTIVTKVTDIEKASSDRQSVRTVGII